MGNVYDLIIVGGGPSGLTAGIYAGRKELKCLIITKDIGGQASTTTQVENYPGFEQTGGFELMQKFQKQAEKFGAEFKYEEVKNVSKKDDVFELETVTDKKYQALALIFSFGMTPRNLNVPGEKEYLSKGVAYCATCDGPLYKDKIVSVVGGGNSALESAEYLADIAKKVYLIIRRDEFRGDKILVDRVKKNKKVEIIHETIVTKINGEKFVTEVELNNVKTNEPSKIKLDGVFIVIGYVVNSEPIKDLVKLDDRNQIITDNNCLTSEPGVFAAGDVTNIEYKQIVISAGEGAKSALSAYKYIQELKGKKVPMIDWKK